MKKIGKTKGIASLLIATVTHSTLGLLALLGPPPASAVTLEKTFAFGPGTQNPRSHFRTFTVPSGLSVTARIEFRRLGGPPGNPDDIPVVFELRQPGPGPNQEGPIVQQTISLAELNQKSVTLTGAPSVRGCANTWRVRVRYDPLSFDPPNPRFDVTGKITVSFDDRAKSVDINAAINIAKGNTVVKGLRLMDPATGNVTQGISGSGTLRIRAEWHTSPLELLHFNSYYKLTVRLKRNGTTVASQSGFSQHAPSEKTPKLDFTHFVAPDEASGDWRLEIESFAPADIVDFHIREAGQFGSTFKPGCN